MGEATTKRKEAEATVAADSKTAFPAGTALDDAQSALRATQEKLKAATEGLHKAIDIEHSMITKAHEFDAAIAGAEKAAETAKHEHGTKEANAKSAALDTRKADNKQSWRKQRRRMRKM